MRIIEANSQKLNLGRQGENRAVQVRFPFVTAWRQTYGTGGTFQLLVQRPGERDRDRRGGAGLETRRRASCMHRQPDNISSQEIL